MILVKITVTVLPDKQKEFEQAADWLIYKQPKKEGNIHKGISRELGKENTFYYLEEWDTREHFEIHCHSDDFNALVGGMKVLGEITEAKVISGANEESLDIS